MYKENVINNSSGNIFNENNIDINIRNSSTSINNEQYKNYEFKEPKEKIEWKHYDQISHHLKPDIERVWLLTQKFDILLLILNQGHYPLVFIKGDNTKKIGNQFQGNMYGDFPFIAKVNKTNDYPEFKKIEWLFFLKNKYYMSIKLELFKVTEDNSTTLVEKIKFDKQELFSELSKYLNSSKARIFNVLEEILENEPINLVIYESGLINGNMKNIWDIVTDFSKLSFIAPNNCFPSHINLKNVEKGQVQQFSIKNKEEVVEFLLELECREDKPGWNKWLIVFNYYKKNSDSKEGIIIIQLTKINNNLCQLTFIEKYLKAKSAEEFREVSKRFQYIIMSIKDYFDNFFSNNNSD